MYWSRYSESCYSMVTVISVTNNNNDRSMICNNVNILEYYYYYVIGDQATAIHDNYITV